ncbi:MAG: peptidylprolyl isomerase [Ferruginibacter sp.]|nr:peptidylprolyl isomerase [Cytophagales bacterium]
MRTLFIPTILALAALSCTPKKVNIDPTNVREVLTQYGRENPETQFVIRTKLGDMRITLYRDTPLHRANFVRLVKQGYFDQAEFYRVVSGFAIQGGDPRANKENFLVPAEFTPHHFHQKGALAMARFEEGNPAKASTPTEFYIVHGERYTEENLREDEAEYGIAATPAQRKAYTTLGGNLELDGKYTVFGQVTQGLDVIDRIAGVRVNGERPAQKIPLTISLDR